MKLRILFVLLALAVAVPTALAQTYAAILELKGTYATTIEVEDAVAQGFFGQEDLIIGDWTLTIHRDGHIDWHFEGPSEARNYDMRSVYVVHDGRFLIGIDTGPHPCWYLHRVASGTSTWSWQGDALAFEAVEDRCIERRIILTATPLVPVEDGSETTD